MKLADKVALLEKLARLTDKAIKAAPQPFRMVIDGRVWACATEGHVLVAVEGDFDERDHYGRLIEPAAGKAAAFFRSSVANYIGQLVSACRRVKTMPLPELRDWAGTATWTRQCSDCGGKGRSRCGVCSGTGEVKGRMKPKIKCQDCRATGKVRCSECKNGTTTAPADRFGIVGGTTVNREYLARALDCIDGDGTCTIGTDGDLEPIHVSGLIDDRKIRIALMPVRLASLPADVPVLDLTMKLPADADNPVVRATDPTADANNIERHAMQRSEP